MWRPGYDAELHAIYLLDAAQRQGTGETEVVIGGSSYPEIWYGWRRLLDLAA